MWWQDLLWGLWNGLTAWIVLIVHVFGGWESHPIYNAVRSGNWYDFGFLIGAGSPFLGAFGARPRQHAKARERRDTPRDLRIDQHRRIAGMRELIA